MSHHFDGNPDTRAQHKVAMLTEEAFELFQEYIECFGFMDGSEIEAPAMDPDFELIYPLLTKQEHLMIAARANQAVLAAAFENCRNPRYPGPALSEMLDDFTQTTSNIIALLGQ